MILPHGVCAIVDLDHVDPTALHPDELAAAAALSPVRAREHLAGRAALRQALATFTITDGDAIGVDDRGAPILPAGFVGSVSHKGNLAAAIVAPADGARIGIDLERRGPMRIDIAPRIMTARELATLPADPVARAAAVLLHFSVKEAIYKAIDPFPFVRRYVGFQEVELAFDEAGAVTVTSAFPLAIAASYREHVGHWLATARAMLHDG